MKIKPIIIILLLISTILLTSCATDINRNCIINISKNICEEYNATYIGYTYHDETDFKTKCEKFDRRIGMYNLAYYLTLEEINSCRIIDTTETIPIQNATMFGDTKW